MSVTGLLSVHDSLSRRTDRDRRPSTVLLIPVKHIVQLRLLLVLSLMLPLAVSAQHLTYPEWQARSQVDARLKPHFQGHVFTPEQTEKVVDAAEDHVMGILNRNRMALAAD